jgi:opacity protein-like surface antigen
MLLLVTGPASGQDTKVVRDLKLWTGAGIEKSVGKDWKFTLEEEFRFQKNATQVGEYFTELGLEYRVDRNISLEAGYRYARNRKKNDSFEERSRYNVDLNYEGNTYYFSFRARARYTKEVEGLLILDPTISYEKYFRTRIEIRYNRLGSLEPYVSGEVFQLSEMFEYPKYDKFRLMGGVRLDAGRPGDINIGYGMIRELNALFPYTYYLLKINYTYKF